MNSIEDPTPVITTTIITNITSLTLIIISILLGGTALGLWVMFYLHSLIVSIIIIGVSFFFPAIFMKRIRRNSIEEVTIEFHTDYFSLAFFDRNSYEFRRKDEIKYSEISSLKVIESSKDDSSFIKLYYKTGTKTVYRFLDQISKNTNVIPLILKYMKSYNEEKNAAEKIYLRKTLFASKFGYYCIVTLTIMLISAIILEIIYKPKAIPVSLMTSTSLYLYILSQRKKDLETDKILHS